MWLACSLCALLAWSGSDLFSKLGSRPDDAYSHWKLVMAVGLAMGLHALYTITLGGVAFDPKSMLTYLPVSALYIGSMVLGYAGLRYIELSVSSPICNSSGAVAVILCLIFLNERLDGLQIAGVALSCAGVFGLAVVEKRADTLRRRAEGETAERRYRTGVLALLFPLLYCLLDGLGTFADAFVLQTLDEMQANVAYEFTFLAMGVFAFVYVVLARRQRVIPRAEGPKALAALCETAGQLAYVYALADAPVLAAPVIACYSAVSVLWSRIFLREKLSAAHYAMIAVALAGVAVLAIE